MDNRQRTEGVVMLHGRRIGPLPHQWQAQMEAAAPVWNAIRERHVEAKQRIEERRRKEWEGLNSGDVVVLSAAMTQEIYGVQLCDDRGEAVLIDGAIVLIEDGMACVTIKRRVGKAQRVRDEMHWLRRGDICRVSDGEQMVWGNSEQALKAAAQRDGHDGGKRLSFWSE